MASVPDSTGIPRLYSREDANRWLAGPRGPLAREMNARGMTNEMLEKLSGVPERRIEMLRSQTEETPVYLEDIVAIGSILGARFLTGVLSNIGMYAAEFNGNSPQKVAGQAIALLQQLTGDAQ